MVTGVIATEGRKELKNGVHDFVVNTELPADVLTSGSIWTLAERNESVERTLTEVFKSFSAKRNSSGVTGASLIIAGPVKMHVLDEN